MLKKLELYSELPIHLLTGFDNIIGHRPLCRTDGLRNL